MKPYIAILVLICYLKTEAQVSVLNIADSLYAVGNYTKAITQYKLLDNPINAYSKLAKSYEAIGNYDQAIQHYNSFLEQNPNQIHIAYQYAKLLFKTNHLEEAKTVMLQLLEADANNANYHYQLGEIFSELKASEKAQQEYFLALKADSSHQKVLYQLSKNFLKQKAYDKVRVYTDLGLKTYANNAPLISIKAQGLYYEKDYHAAIVQFEKLLSLGTKTKFIYEKLSLCYAKTYRDKQAIDYMLKALELDPTDAKNRFLLGRFYFNTEDYLKAEKEIKLAIKLQDQALDREYNKLGAIYNYLKQPEDAIRAFAMAVKENPSNEESVFYLAFVKDNYYKDVNARLEAYKGFEEKFPKSKYVPIVKQRVSQLKKEEFMKSKQ